MNHLNENKIINNFIKFANTQKNIIAVILFGSYAREDHKADKNSDIDFYIIAKNISEYIHNNDWLNRIGKYHFNFTEETFASNIEKRVLFEDMKDADFIFCKINNFFDETNLSITQEIFQRGYKVLIDKNNILSNFEVPLYRSTQYSPNKILNDINDYFFHSAWAIKKLSRGETWSAMNCLNCYMKDKLLSMIETYTIIISDPQKNNLWHNGRFIEKWANKNILTKLDNCFAQYNINKIKKALISNLELYDFLAKCVAQKLDLKYPEKEIQILKNWLINFEI